VNEHETLVEWHWQGNWSIVMKICLSATSSTTHLTLWTFWDWTQATLVKGWNLGPCHGSSKRPGNTVRAWAGPDICRRSRLPLFKTVVTWRREGCQTYALSVFTPHGDILGAHFCYGLSLPQGHRIMSTKNSNDTSGNRTRDLVAWSAVWPQYKYKLGNNLYLLCES
jgi:hypothetical protein